MSVNRKKIGAIAIVAAVALAGAAGVAGIAIAKSGDRENRGFHPAHSFAAPGGRMGFGGNMLRMARALDLNDEQREKARALMNDIDEFRRERREATRETVSELFTRDSLSPQDAAKMLALREQHRAENRAFMSGKLSEFHAILTPAQRERAVALMTERRRGFRGFHRGDRHHDGKHHRRRGRDRDDD